MKATAPKAFPLRGRCLPAGQTDEVYTAGGVGRVLAPAIAALRGEMPCFAGRPEAVPYGCGKYPSVIARRPKAAVAIRSPFSGG